jgi:hypothetical protein
MCMTIYGSASALVCAKLDWVRSMSRVRARVWTSRMYDARMGVHKICETLFKKPFELSRR